MAEGFHTIADEETLKHVVALARAHADAPKGPDGQILPEFESYLGQIVRYATGEDRNWEEPHTLLERAIGAWSVSATRKTGQSLVALRLVEADDWREARLVLDIATDDKPFLVDSISGALTEAGKPVSFFVNAVVDAHRDHEGARNPAGRAVRESLIHAEMDPPVDASETAALKAEIENILGDVAAAVSDWEPMRARLAACIAQLERARPQNVDRADLKEAIDFLKWLWDNRFAFLGVRRYEFSVGSDGAARFEHLPSEDLGVMKDATKRILRPAYHENGALAPAVADFMTSGEPIIIAKTNTRSTVHRRVHMDYVGVKTYSVDGKVVGEDRFVGLFTADAYNRPASDIPLLRAKVRDVVEGSGFTPGGHNEKALVNILETYPRDEMFQTDIEELKETALGILRLFKRPRTKLFLRRDRFDRFVSALVFVPRDRFSSSVREQIGEILCEAYDGRVTSFTPHFGDATLVRVHFIIGIRPGAPAGPGLAELTRRIRAVTRTWSDGLIEELRTRNAGVIPRALFARYDGAFGAGYMERTPPAAALDDIAALESLGGKARGERVFRAAGDPEHALNIKLYCRGGPLRLSDLIPKLENLGLSVVQESGYSATPQPPTAGESFWIHEFHTEERSGRPINEAAIRRPLEEALAAVLDGRTENDGFNALVVLSGLSWREAWLLRAMAKYILQTGLAFSQPYIEETFARHPMIARALVAAFHARFNPSGPTEAEARETEAHDAEARVRDMLDGVDSLDEDRIFRRFLSLLGAMTRTNYYQKSEKGGPKTYISFKVESGRLEEIPEPKPFREIFMSGPRVDGVHLRFGPVARGGLRWSDRREDFRTEVLGLVKAQRVKNAVIVPTGSKGGFYPKQLPSSGDRSAVFEEGREAYKEFIRSLLDLTDNIVDGEVISPPDVVRWDDQDPYLVVAADKGTATFSDTANGIAGEYGFWLGDAFASGGSAGYDHKVMGITARGAWEAVKRHFREMGKNIQEEPFTVAGIGDMSGDVFGNGMLLSQQIRLVAAFDHRDIFIDPNPDAAASWTERKRMFELPRSSWADYNKTLISKGGGVFSRSSKSIPVSHEMRELLGLSSDKATPQEVMRAILKLPVELFWLGGIGTYFKAASEENIRVGDKANDAIRIDAEDMRMKVIGEGANLGLTQEARIVFARRGGRLNTDAIDNSAGVDSSDHEVNIKILLSLAIEKGELKREDREALLKDMTENVASHVLRHNYDQTRAISLMESTAARDLEDYARFMNALESEGRLDRAIEGLPDEKRLASMKAHGHGLTRPELSVVMAYAKMKLFEELVASGVSDDPMLERELFGYFPDQLHAFQSAIVQHRLRREIIATRLSNEIIDTCGATFASRVIEATGAGYADLAIAYESARRILELRAFAAAVDALDTFAPSQTQLNLYAAASSLLTEQVYRILRDVAASETAARRGVKGLVETYKTPIDDLKADLGSIMPAAAAEAMAARAARLTSAGAPAALAREASMMPSLEFALDIVNLSASTKWSPAGAGAVFFAVGQMFGIDQARNQAREVPAEGRFDRLAMRRLTEDFAARQAALARNIIVFSKKQPKGQPQDWSSGLVEKFSASHSDAVTRYDAFVQDLALEAGASIGKLTLMSRALSDLEERTAPR